MELHVHSLLLLCDCCVLLAKQSERHVAAEALPVRQLEEEQCHVLELEGCCCVSCVNHVPAKLQVFVSKVK